MNNRRVSVSIPGADARLLVEAAQLADANNLGIWVGDPRTLATNSDDCYVTTTAAAVAGATSHCRIGLFLSLRGSGTSLRLAEDIAVVDQASGGRVELGLVAPTDQREDWEACARGLLESWHLWPIEDDLAVMASPGPAQPWMPRLIVGSVDATELAERLRGGLLELEQSATSAPAAELPDTTQRRVVLAVPVTGSVRQWLADDVLGTMQALRADADRARAQEILVILTDPDRDRLGEDIETIGVVVGASVRCPAHKLDFLPEDAWRWLTELAHLH